MLNNPIIEKNKGLLGERYYIKGTKILHRTDGPAIVDYKNKSKNKYYLNGELKTKQEFLMLISKEKIQISKWLESESKQRKFKYVLCLKDVGFFKEGLHYKIADNGIISNNRRVTSMGKKWLYNNFKLIENKENPTIHDKLIYTLYYKKARKIINNRRKLLSYKGLLKNGFSGMCIWFIEEIFDDIEGEKFWFTLDETDNTLYIHYTDPDGKNVHKWSDLKRLIGSVIDGDGNCASFYFMGKESEYFLKLKYNLL